MRNTASDRGTPALSIYFLCIERRVFIRSTYFQNFNSLKKEKNKARSGRSSFSKPAWWRLIIQLQEWHCTETYAFFLHFPFHRWEFRSSAFCFNSLRCFTPSGTSDVLYIAPLTIGRGVVGGTRTWNAGRGPLAAREDESRAIWPCSALRVEWWDVISCRSRLLRINIRTRLEERRWEFLF